MMYSIQYSLVMPHGVSEMGSSSVLVVATTDADILLIESIIFIEI